ncbi:MAG: RAMP superfamily protein [Chloroflexi bacterium]|nr:RAMP superfamily protein [Chloroflexota bacterium]
MILTLIVTLLSDTTFGRGDGVAGLVDEEIEHDPATGLPFIRGRTLKGLIVEECANLLYALDKTPTIGDLRPVAEWLFGSGGSTLNDGAHLHIGRGELPDDLRRQVLASGYKASEILDSLTTIRRQTAIDEETSISASGSLRSSRVLLRDLNFRAVLEFDQEPTANHLALLSACVASVRRAGSGRNRGRGRVALKIEGDQESFEKRLEEFEQLIKKGIV